MNEQQLQKKIQNYLKGEGYSVFKTIACNRNGIADIIACSPKGRFVAIEVKAPGKLKQVSKLQELYLDEVKSRGGVALLTDNLEHLKDSLKG